MFSTRLHLSFDHIENMPLFNFKISYVLYAFEEEIDSVDILSNVTSLN